MKIVQRKISDITPYDRNPRINDIAVDAVARSIHEFGFRQPIVVDDHGVILAGHTRWKAAQKLGLDTVPVHVATGLSEAQARAYRIADNKVAELAEWDTDILTTELMDLHKTTIDINLLGFNTNELEKLLGASIHGNEGLTDPDAVPEPPDATITRPGDLWLLGNHRLLCGDAVKAEDVDRLLDGAPVHMVFIDPPYGHNNNDGDLIHNLERALGTSQVPRQPRPIMNDSPEDCAAVVDGAIRQISRVLTDGCCCCCCCSGGGGPDPQFARWSLLLDQMIGFKMAVVWDKGGLGLGWHYRRCYELVLVAQKPGASGRWFGGDSVPNVIRDIPKIIPQADNHPTEKPVALPARFIQWHSQPGENILDLFGGSGSTLIAAEQTGRHAYLMELDPFYCDFIVRRWEAFTGHQAALATPALTAPTPSL